MPSNNIIMTLDVHGMDEFRRALALLVGWLDEHPHGDLADLTKELLEDVAEASARPEPPHFAAPPTDPWRCVPYVIPEGS